VQGKKRILVTSALPYANGPIHLGHLAGAYLPADIFVRYNRLKGNDVIYICGSDEHGVPIILRARAENISPQEVVDYYHNKNKESFEKFGITFDYYGRTSSKIHHQTSQQFFRDLANKDVFTMNSEEQLFDPEAKMFLADRFVRGTCPHCEYEEAYGDQCERCGSSLSPTDLINPRSAITNAKPIMKTSTHWYLPLSIFQKDLESWINNHKNWKPNVLGQIHSWFDHGLKDRAVTRDLSWGVPVPEDVTQEVEVDASGKVLYVWFDAPIGYISATIEWSIEQNKPDLWKLYWQDRNTKLIHFIGKDNIVFHCLIFPAMLMAHGDYILPDNVPANEFLNLEGKKLSTSRNYAVWLYEYLEKFNADSLRYCLANNLPETRDSDFSWKDFQARHNNELADILGNFINRTITFAEKHFEGKVPDIKSFDTLDKRLIKTLEKAPESIGKSLEDFQIRQAVKKTMDLVRFANKYFNDKTPWITVKTDIDRCGTTINLCLQTIKAVAILFEPIIPYASEKIKKILNIPNNDFRNMWDIAGNISLGTGHKLNSSEILFKKIEDRLIEQQVEKLKLVLESNSEEDNEIKEISMEQFDKIDLKLAEIIDAIILPKADKLFKLQVKLGEEEKQIIAGLAQHYQAKDLIGKKVVIVANLKPIKILGELSEGMLLTAKSGSDIALLTTDKNMLSGTIIR
jgi:methionyl-tRNA synthetase